MTRSGVILTVLLVVSAGLLLQAEEQLRTLSGSCSISTTANATAVNLRLERDDCRDGRDCGSTQTQEPLDAFLGFRLEDLKREGAHIDAMIRAEAGTLTCSGAIHDGRLSGGFQFVPDPLFVSRMAQMGYRDLDSEKLQAYTLFRIGTEWIHSLEAAGVRSLDSGKLIALRIFHVDAGYVRKLEALGYSNPEAGKLIALKVQNVDPDEVKQIRALGYQPTLDELVEMRIFKVTPDFIRRMQAKGLHDLTISKLVQIRIFQLAD
ncbi:MAG TPA: hypothetical protein VMB49_02990 [Acidobacteriaceae bacterium]|nr:hypothetical protein [Acidobacteriaceae bacterium]